MKFRTTILVLLLAVLVGYLLYTPIPAGMVDQRHYILLSAGMKIATLVAALRTLVQPGDDIYYQTVSFMSEIVLPAADSKVQDSNVEARYTEFDGVRVLLYEPLTKRKDFAPGFVFFHGGGYAFGSPRSHGPLSRKLAEELDMVVVSVEYRLAPAHPFPAGFEDCLAATKWFLKHAAEYGVDASRVVVGGDSAGGHLSAVISQHVHDDASLPDIRLQLLFYPWMQCLDFNTPSFRNYEESFGDTGVIAKPRVAEFMSALLLGRLDQHFITQVQANSHTSAKFKQSVTYKRTLDHTIVYEKLNISPATTQEGGSSEGNATLWAEIQDRLLDPRLSPLFRKDFKGLPKAFIATMDLDSLRDDGIFYARLLEEAGVEVTWKNYQGAYHAIVAAGPIKDIPTGVKIVNDAIDFVRDNI